MEDGINIKITDIISEEENDLLDKTAISYCEGIPNTDTNDLKDYLHLSKAEFLFAFGEIEGATKSLTVQLESLSAVGIGATPKAATAGSFATEEAEAIAEWRKARPAARQVPP